MKKMKITTKLRIKAAKRKIDQLNEDMLIRQNSGFSGAGYMYKELCWWQETLERLENGMDN